ATRTKRTGEGPKREMEVNLEEGHHQYAPQDEAGRRAHHHAYGLRRQFRPSARPRRDRRAARRRFPGHGRAGTRHHAAGDDGPDVYHCAAVKRGVQRAHLVGDMPFGSYQGTADEAVKNAVRLVAEGGAESVKLEGGAEYADVVQRIVRAGVPVMGHIGLTPQSVHKLGGYVVQGRTEEKAQKLLA